MESYNAMAYEMFRRIPPVIVRLEFQLPGFVHRIIRYYSETDASDAVLKIASQGGQILKRTRYEESDD